jgi:hypothetical protein
VYVRVDERGSKHESGSVDDAVPVALERGADRRDYAVVDANLDGRVDTFDRIEHTRACDDE